VHPEGFVSVPPPFFPAKLLRQFFELSGIPAIIAFFNNGSEIDMLILPGFHLLCLEEQSYKKIKNR